jgi:hypothetical protein
MEFQLSLQKFGNKEISRIEQVTDQKIISPEFSDEFSAT